MTGKEPRPVLAVGGVVLTAVGSGDVGVCLIRRGKPPGEGAWSLPGGKVEFGERLEDAVRREMRENSASDKGVYGLREDQHQKIIDFLNPAQDADVSSAHKAALWAIAGGYALLPIVLKVIAVSLSWRFPITAAKQAQIQRILTTRRSRLPHAL